LNLFNSLGHFTHNPLERTLGALIIGPCHPKFGVSRAVDPLNSEKYA